MAKSMAMGAPGKVHSTSLMAVWSSASAINQLILANVAIVAIRPVGILTAIMLVVTI
jgi:hypothetical protein